MITKSSDFHVQAQRRQRESVPYPQQDSLRIDLLPCFDMAPFVDQPEHATSTLPVGSGLEPSKTNIKEVPSPSPHQVQSVFCNHLNTDLVKPGNVPTETCLHQNNEN